MFRSQEVYIDLDKKFIGLFVLLIAILLLLGFIFGLAIANDENKSQAIQNGCAHYDPITSKFTWNKE